MQKNSKDLFQHPKNRYRKVKFDRRLEGGQYHFALSEPLDNAKDVVVPLSYTEYLQDPARVTELFLEKLTSAGNWIAAPWRPEDNPWLNGKMPIVGSAITARVTEFVNHRIAIAETKIGGVTFEMAIFSENLPPFVQSLDIRQVLFKGDLIAGDLMTPDRANLRLRINPLSWLQKQHLAWRREIPDLLLDEVNLPDREAKPDTSKWRELLTGKVVLHIEDDNLFCQLLGQKFQRIGATSLIASETSEKGLLETVYQALKQKPDFILLDFQLDLREGKEEEVRAYVADYLDRQPDAKCLLLTGNLDSALEFAVENGYGCLFKPVDTADVVAWFLDPQPAKAEAIKQRERPANQLFASERKTERAISLATELLERLTDQHGLIGAIWLMETSDGQYSYRAGTNEFQLAPSPEILQALDRSIVGHAKRQMEPLARFLPEKDPLNNIAELSHFRDGGSPVYVFAVPLLAAPDQAPRILLFFKHGKIDAAVQDSLLRREDHYKLLIEMINQADEIDEIAASAQVGRAALGALHEIRHALGRIVQVQDDDQKINDEKLAQINILLREIRETAFELMSDFRPSRQNILPLKETIVRFSRFTGRSIKDRDNEFVTDLVVAVEPVENIILDMSPIPLERALSNLVENANDFVKLAPKVETRKAPPRKIWITADKVDDESERPIKIRVRDSGIGLHSNNYKNLFRSRTTGRPEDSTGLGLYLSREHIESIGGTLEVELQPRWAGACFVISLAERLGKIK